VDFLIPISIIKFSVGLFFLIILAYYDIYEGRIPNKLLLIMLLVGLVINFFSLDFWKEILLTILASFIFSYIFWELSFLNAGDVKLLTILPLYLPYNTLINPMESLFFILITLFILYYSYLFIKRLLKDKEFLKIVFKEYFNYLKNINWISLFVILFSLSVILNFVYYDPLLTLLLVLISFLAFDYFVSEELKPHVLLFFFVVSLFVFLKTGLYNDFTFYKQLLFVFVLIIVIRTLLYISSYFISTKSKKIEELKVGDKLALVPVKINNSYQLHRLIPYNIFSIYFIKKHAIDDYDPSIGLQKDNINKIKKFFKMNHLYKVKVFEEVPFLPFLFLSFILYYCYYFLTYFS